MVPETQLIFDIALLLSAAGLLSILFGKLRLPATIGYLAGGVLLGSSVIRVSKWALPPWRCSRPSA